MHTRTGDGSNDDGIFRVSVGSETDRVAFAEGLTASVDGTKSNRQAASGSENGTEGPATEDVPRKSLLRFVERILVHKEQVVNEFGVKASQAVTPAQVKRICRCVPAGCLYYSSSREGLRISEVGLRG